jgi:hypothetical protein
MLSFQGWGQTCNVASLPINLQGVRQYYPFCSDANDVVYNTTNDGNGIIAGAFLSGTDRFGNANSAYQFNGNGSYIYFNQLGTSFLDGAFVDNFTISFWIKNELTAALASHIWWSKNNSFSIGINPDKTISFTKQGTATLLTSSAMDSYYIF